MMPTKYFSSKQEIAVAKYLEWEVKGTVVAVNCMTLDMLKKTDYPKQAYELGKSL